MKAEDWNRIMTLFNQAVELGESERAAFLEAHCDDAKIRRQVSLMLLADEGDTQGDLTGILTDAASESFGQEIRPGELIGNWRVVREIDRGGMGSVYLADRADGEFVQRAAVKVVNVALAGSAAVERFVAERQILARLQHPNIAQLLDGGTTSGGVPYLVMEYVDGERIDRYCDKRRLDTRQRLALFKQVCAAIHVAHQNLVVHRDIKPGNILVTDDGIPKLLDFGIAKLLAPDVAGAPAVTQANMRLLTPEYASPEQVLGGAITTASDIYSLGVLLYQLLSGFAPYKLDDYSPQSLARAICETQPQRPSTLAGTGDGNSEVFGARRTTPARLSKRLRGDLDNIVLMAMRKEPERRYPSALRMAEDIDHYLKDRPVLARTDTLGYRVGKYIRRNAAAVATSAAAVLTVGLLVSFYTLQLSKERDRARSEAAKATQTAEFLQNLFSVVDPAIAQGDEVTARSLLDQGARQIDATLEDQPDVQAALQETIGRVYWRLGLFEEAIPLFERSLATQASLHGDTGPEIVPTLLKMAELSEERGDFQQADELSGRALAISRDADGNDLLLANTLRVRGQLLTSRGEFERGRDTLIEAKQAFDKIGQQNHPDYARTLTRLALAHDDLGEYDEALVLLEEALQRHRDVHGPVHPLTTDAQQALAVTQDRQHLYEEAEANYLEALANARRLYGDVHPVIGTLQGNIGRLYTHMDRDDDAGRYMRAALATTREVYGEDHHYVGYDTVALAKNQAATGNREHAAELMLEALANYEKSLPEAHPYMAAALVTYAKILKDLERYEEALTYAQRSRVAATEALSEEHWLVAQIDVMIGALYVDTGRDGARELLTSGFERLLKISGREHTITRFALSELLAVLESEGDDEALAHYSAFLDAGQP